MKQNKLYLFISKLFSNIKLLNFATTEILISEKYSFSANITNLKKDMSKYLSLN